MIFGRGVRYRAVFIIYTIFQYIRVLFSNVKKDASNYFMKGYSVVSFESLINRRTSSYQDALRTGQCYEGSGYTGKMVYRKKRI